MLIAGIWHGAAWGFIIWGGLHGLALVVNRLTEVLSKQLSITWIWNSLPGILIAWLITQLMVFTTWIFFRLPNLQDSWLVINRLWGHTADVQFAHKVYVEALGLERHHLVILLSSVFGLMAITNLLNRGLKLELNWTVKLALVPLSFFTVWLLAPAGGLPYIYFDF
jgi:predicted Co/Zn/Cd cation transporter (cation efflux family)